jgi:hypothetical protein
MQNHFDVKNHPRGTNIRKLIIGRRKIVGKILEDQIEDDILDKNFG